MLFTVGALILGSIFAATLLIVMILTLQLLRRRRRERREIWVRGFLSVAVDGAGVSQVRDALDRDVDAFMRAYISVNDTMKLPEPARRKVETALEESGVETTLLHDVLDSRSKWRKRAAVFLGYIQTERVMRTLVFALEREHSASIRIHIVQSLVRLQFPAAIPTIVDSLAGSSREYQQRVQGLLSDFGSEVLEYFPVLENRDEYEIQLLLLHLASRYPGERTRGYVKLLTESDSAGIRHVAVKTFVRSFASHEETQELLDSEDVLTVNLALGGLSSMPSRSAFQRAVEKLQLPAHTRSAVSALSDIVTAAPYLYEEVLVLYRNTDVPEIRTHLEDILALKIEYLLERYVRSAETHIGEVIRALLRHGWTTGIIGFLNRNDDSRVRSLLVHLISPVLHESRELRREFRDYGKQSVIRVLDLGVDHSEPESGPVRDEAVRSWTVMLVIGLTVLLPIAAYFAVWPAVGPPLVFGEMVAGYLRVFLWGFGGYAAALNASYVVLMALGAVETARQRRDYDLKPRSMLFRSQMLPSVSVVVPAYREEATIVTNVNSLLNLRYPDFEVVVVNDGSPDGTLQALIDHFELERVDTLENAHLSTQAIRGTYRNPAVSELTVVDKRNGGKADSLNAGLNVATGEYFAAIDSDSILERDALLRMTAGFIDSEVPVVATGGNVLPVNGCRVDSGVISETGIPRHPIAALQTIEYLRSFLGGRTGWAHIGSLMIISGAFGLFRRRDVVSARGYLTGAEAFGKDTVAEDMELVIRISRELRRQGRAARIQYAAHANCWTEVPEQSRILAGQRDRWQRGLIDTMAYHGRLLANRRYGSMGLIGFPYYALFELLGPWIEAQGLLFLIVAALTGVVPAGLLLLVFAVAVPLGVISSVTALLLGRDIVRRFSVRDRVVLVLMSVLENFGYRQFVSFLRIRGYISVLRRRSGWGNMIRKGWLPRSSS